MRSKVWIFLAVLVAATLIGCGGPRATVYIHQEYNFGFIERVGVVPFKNVSREQGAAERATSFFITELLVAEAFDVLEPGEVQRLMVKYGVTGLSELTAEQIKGIGTDGQVQALFVGTVSEATAIRSGSSQTYSVTIDIRLVETESGRTIWSATNTEKGTSVWKSIFGGSGKSQSEVMRKCVHDVLKTLID
jgi:hypothetical protein